MNMSKNTTTEIRKRKRMYDENFYVNLHLNSYSQIRLMQKWMKKENLQANENCHIYRLAAIYLYSE